MTEQTKREICELYADKSVKAGDIAKMYKIGGGDLVRIITEQGLQPRRPSRIVKRTKDENKKCPQCKKRVDLKGARFCPYCGADIRSEREIVIERLESLFGLFALLPANVCDKAQQTILQTVEYLKKEK